MNYFDFFGIFNIFRRQILSSVRKSAGFMANDFFHIILKSYRTEPVLCRKVKEKILEAARLFPKLPLFGRLCTHPSERKALCHNQSEMRLQKY